MADRFERKYFVNCDKERELFEQLISLQSEKRILSIVSAEGTGKSFLQEMFLVQCRTSDIPACLITLNDTLSSFEFVKILVEKLKLSITFNQFNSLYRLFLDGRYNEVLAKATIKGKRTKIEGKTTVNASDFSYAYQPQIGSTIINLNVTAKEIDKSLFDSILQNLPSLPQPTDELREIAQQECIKACFEDIQKHFQRIHNKRSKTPVVILLDRYEAATLEFKRWVEEEFLKQYFFNPAHSDNRLVFVVTGREVPDFEANFPKERCQALTNQIKGLAKWSLPHIEACLDVRNVDKNQAPYLYALYSQSEFNALNFITWLELLTSNMRRL